MHKRLSKNALSSAQVESAEEAIVWCLDRRDSGLTLTDREALETFPEYAQELLDFFDSERALFNNFGSMASHASLPYDFGYFFNPKGE